jgi:hypothetical protein
MRDKLCRVLQLYRSKKAYQKHTEKKRERNEKEKNVKKSNLCSPGRGVVGLLEKDTAHACTWCQWPTTPTLENNKKNNNNNNHVFLA